MDDPVYPLSEAARVTGWPVTTMRDYFARGIFEWQETDGVSAVAGLASRLTLRSILRLAVAREIWVAIQRPKEAFLAAVAFTDLGSGSKFQVTRLPGQLFEAPYRTIMAYRPGLPPEIMPIEYGVAVDLDDLTIAPFAQPGPVIVIDLGRVVSRVLKEFC